VVSVPNAVFTWLFEDETRSRIYKTARSKSEAADDKTLGRGGGGEEEDEEEEEAVGGDGRGVDNLDCLK